MKALEAETVGYGLRGVNAARMRAIEEHAGTDILDVGCGSGAYVVRLAHDRNIYGVDRIPYPTWKEFSGRFVVSAADRLPFPDESVDTVLSFEVLEHLPQPVVALREYHRVARRNVIVTVPNCSITDGLRHSNLLYSHWSDRTHINFFDLQHICSLVRAAGFHISEQRLINRLSLVPLIAEASGRAVLMRGPIRRIVERLLPRPYLITCLVVGSKDAPRSRN